MSDETPADDLRSLLSAAVDESAAAAVETNEAAAKPAAETSAEKPDAAEAASKAADRARAADGKFAKKDGEAEPKADAKADHKADAKAKPDEKEAAKTGAKPEGDDKAADKSVEPKAGDKGDELLSKWSASDKAMFKLQSPEAQEFLLRRHRAMEADYTKKLMPLAVLKKEFEPIQQMFAPHLDVLKAKGLTPASTIKAWANIETALASGKGIDVIRGMIQGYGIDKAALGKALGFTSATAAEPSIEKVAGAESSTSTAHQPINLPPELLQELRELRARVDAKDNNDRQAQANTAREREAKVETDITHFKTATDEKGELKHPYYEEVEPAMIALAQSYVASKQPLPPLPELYETAVWANPSTRAAVLASQKQAEKATAAEEARAKAASARRAGSSVTGAPGSGQATSAIRGEMSLREQLEEAAAS